MSADVGVVGAGIVGLATAHALHTAGHAVTVYEATRPGAGQSGGATRIFRHLHDDPRLAAIARAARRRWEDWSVASGRRLISSDGAVAVGPDVARRARSARTAGVAVDDLDVEGFTEALPIAEPATAPAVLDHRGGAIRADQAIAWLSDELAGCLVTDQVLLVQPTATGAEVRLGDRRVRHDAVVVCTGRATATLASRLGITVPVREELHVRATFALRDDGDRFTPGRLATLQDASRVHVDDRVYGGPVAGNHQYVLGAADAVDATGGIDPAALAALEARAVAYVEAGLPGLDPQPVATRACWTAELPWGGDGLGVWHADRVWLVAGHNLFKLAPWLGDALADAAVTGELRPDLRPAARLGAAADASVDRAGHQPASG